MGSLFFSVQQFLFDPSYKMNVVLWANIANFYKFAVK